MTIYRQWQLYRRCIFIVVWVLHGLFNFFEDQTPNYFLFITKVYYRWLYSYSYVYIRFIKKNVQVLNLIDIFFLKLIYYLAYNSRPINIHLSKVLDINLYNNY